jgi:DNA/RNA endonuclease G (NUC1)
MRLLFSLLLLWSGSVFAQLNDSLVWNTPYFKIVYSEVLEQPRRVEYSVPCPKGTASRSGLDFYTEKGIKTSDRHDYVNNEWDKGHMAPAAAFSCTRDMIAETFTYVNCALQQENLNRGAWRLLEAKERKLAEHNQVQVLIVVEFGKGAKKLPTGATIPTGFYKEIRYDNIRECYYFPNSRPATTDFTNFVCKCR